MGRVLLLWLVACSYERGQATIDAAPPIDIAPDIAIDAKPPSFHVHVEAWMDGVSQLVITGNTLRWHHIEYAAPGREDPANYPTKLDGVDWFPVWPDEPDAENRDCNCDSSTYSGLTSAVPHVPATPMLTIIQARQMPSIVQAPTAANGYTLIVELDDAGPGGSAWHIIDIAVNVD